ncbi:PEP-CTERM sorting domain-containing protein [Roseateles sp.]|uniref:PEP-CTERM sorting domain-containing protein n=1 Tax=Roseateles sp. TaxID=1971397 RepID=UPI0039EA8BED
MSKSLRLAAAALLTVLAASAQAGFVTTSQGVAFSLQALNANTFTLDIQNANHATGNWSSATSIGYLGLKGLGSLAGLTGVNVTVSSNSGAPVSWTLASFSGELGGQGCNKNANSGGICLDGLADLTLVNDLLFTIQLMGSGIDLTGISAPHLKVGFTQPNSSKPVGDLLSVDMTYVQPTGGGTPSGGTSTGNTVPEPASLALAGLALLGLAATRRRRSA